MRALYQPAALLLFVFIRRVRTTESAPSGYRSPVWTVGVSCVLYLPLRRTNQLRQCRRKERSAVTRRASAEGWSLLTAFKWPQQLKGSLRALIVLASMLSWKGGSCQSKARLSQGKRESIYRLQLSSSREVTFYRGEGNLFGRGRGGPSTSTSRAVELNFTDFTVQIIFIFLMAQLHVVVSQSTHQSKGQSLMHVFTSQHLQQSRWVQVLWLQWLSIGFSVVIMLWSILKHHVNGFSILSQHMMWSGHPWKPWIFFSEND